MFKPDLVLVKAGHPLVAIEAKSRPVPNDLQAAVRHQLLKYSVDSNTRWAMLIDPSNTLFFKTDQNDEPFARLSTEELLGDVFPSRSNVVGEQVLLLALNRLIPHLQHRKELLRKHPELEVFARAVAGAEPESDPAPFGS